MKLLEFHQALLEDHQGQHAFERALRHHVKPDSVVLDVGTGTGIHSLFACRAGAERVYAVELGPIAEVAAEVFRANGVGERVTLLRQDALDIELAEQVDVLIHHQGVKVALDLVPVLRQRWLKKTGATVPETSAVMAAPAESESAFRHVQFWQEQRYGFTFSAGEKPAANSSIARHVFNDELLSPPATLAIVDYLGTESSRMVADAAFEVTRRGTLHGFSFWYCHQLAPGITVCSGPESRRNLHVWPSYFAPIAAPVAVNSGDRVKLKFQTAPGDWYAAWAWSGEVWRGEQQIGSFAQSTMFEEPLSPQALRQRIPGHVPELNSRGEAARLVLEHCSQSQPLASIEAALKARFPQLFSHDGQAQVFVSRVLQQYSK